MKFKLPSLLLALSSAVILAPSAHAVATANGDLLIGFYQVINGSVQSKTYIFNLGQASLYRENSQSNVLVSAINPAITSSNIGQDLATIFGADWNESGSVYWSVFGGRELSAPLVVADGDCSATSYASVPATTFVVGKSTTPYGVSGNPRTTLANSIAAIRDHANGTGSLPVVEEGPPVIYLSGANARGAQINTTGASTIATVEQFFPPTTALWLGVAGEKRGLFDVDTLTNSATIEGALDIYRFVNSVTLSGMDLTSGFGTGNAALGTGQYCGTVTIDTDGNLRVFGSGGAVTSGYSTWATTNAVTGQAANLDHDNDGVSNGIEYFIGGPTGNTTGFTALPGVTTAGSVSSVTFTKAASYTGVYATDFVVETSTNLATGSWTTQALNTTVTVSGNNVTFTFPAGPTTTFARLRVTGP